MLQELQRASNQTANRGTSRSWPTGGKVTGNGLDVVAKVTGGKSVGVYSAGNANIGAANITTSNGAVNFFAENGTISIKISKVLLKQEQVQIEDLYYSMHQLIQVKY